MEWTSDALVLGTRVHGESSVVLEVMTAERGRHLGLVRGGRSRRLQPVLQAGNVVRVTWRARLDQHLGNFAVELVRARAAGLMETAVGLLGLQILTSHLRLLPERDPHPTLEETAGIILDHMGDPVDTGRLLVRFELALLEELGFRLDLSACAATGQTSDLVYVSPRSGRAVGRIAGAPYADRLLPLPAFLLDPAQPATAEDVRAGFRLTGAFLERHVCEPRAVPLPDARARLIARL